MYPSFSSTSSTRARSADPGLDTLDLLRICALRMRAIRSPSGSLRAIVRPSSPARLDEARDDALGAELPQRDAAHLELAVEPARPPVISQRLRTRVAEELRGNCASFSAAANRSSVGSALSRATALSRDRLPENFFASLRRRLFFSIELFFAI